MLFAPVPPFSSPHCIRKLSPQYERQLKLRCPKGPGKRGHIVAHDVSWARRRAEHKMNVAFPCCANWETFVADTKCFWTKSETFFVSRTQNLCPQQMLHARANGETFVSSTMCPQQCVFVCQGLKRPWQTRAHCCGHIVAHDVSWARKHAEHKMNVVFPCCANWETFVADTKCFWSKSETLFVSRTQNLCPQQMLRARANGETFVSATMCPQQCVLVSQGLNETIR